MIFEQPVLQLQTSLFDRDISAPADFLLGPRQMIWQIPQTATPYCADFERQSLICVTSPDVLSHPFLYKAQRQHARTVINIPFAELPFENAAPTLIFSPGRCGSTLLFGILHALGLPCVSEPDYFRQVVAISVLGGQQPNAAYVRVLRAATAMLAKKLGNSSPIIKLHLACNEAPLLIANAFASVKIIFIVRGFSEWLISLKRVNPSLPAEAAIGIFKKAIYALYRLSQSYEVRICHYRDFAKLDVDYVRDLASFLGYDKTVSPELLQQVLSRDSQEGTSVSRDKMATRRVSQAFIKHAARLWEQARPGQMIRELGLPEGI